MNIEELIKVIEDTEDLDEKRDIFLGNISSLNGDEYNYNKLAEECCELGADLLKYNNKKEGYRPSKETILKELVDVLLRIHIAFPEIDDGNSELSEFITERGITKIDKMLAYFLQEKHAKI